MAIGALGHGGELVLAGLLQAVRELDDQDSALGHEPYQRDQADLAVDVERRDGRPPPRLPQKEMPIGALAQGRALGGRDADRPLERAPELVQEIDALGGHVAGTSSQATR
jgi:hypothetical protein